MEGIMSIQTQSFDPSIQRIGVVRSYARKSEIVREDDPASRVYEVIAGTVCTSKMLREGRRQIAGFYLHFRAGKRKKTQGRRRGDHQC
jgi:CRP-like cAMP-binding protein